MYDLGLVFKGIIENKEMWRSKKLFLFLFLIL